MAKRKETIDLRKKPKERDGEQPKFDRALRPTLAHAILAPATFALPEVAFSPPPPLLPALPTLPDVLEWTTFEHEQIDMGASWYAIPGGIMAILFALALFVKNYFFAVFVLIAFAALVLFRNQPPKKINFSITKDGVRAGKSFYHLSRIKSFWIFQRPGHPELSLETSQTFSPYVRIPLGDMDQQRLRDLLFTLPIHEQQHQEFLLDEIMRIIGF